MTKIYKEPDYIDTNKNIVVCPKCKIYTVPETTSGDLPPEIIYICQGCKSVFRALAKIEVFRDCDVCEVCEECEIVKKDY
ncbi:hypothetical protein LCGC14_1138320 [marine sediment metagenome]|uniref:Uncharacterized protein n=1 Tax=marine sediment metagenome TaxID=412755 RepID=A0A0F9LZ71_9ZZZZ